MPSTVAFLVASKSTDFRQLQICLEESNQKFLVCTQPLYQLIKWMKRESNQVYEQNFIENSNLMKYLDQWLKEVHADSIISCGQKNYFPTFSIFEQNNAIFIQLYFGIKENFGRDIF